MYTLKFINSIKFIQAIIGFDLFLITKCQLNCSNSQEDYVLMECWIHMEHKNLGKIGKKCEKKTKKFDFGNENFCLTPLIILNNFLLEKR